MAPQATLFANTFQTTKKAALITKAAFFNSHQLTGEPVAKRRYAAEMLSTAVLPERSSTFVS